MLPVIAQKPKIPLKIIFHKKPKKKWNSFNILSIVQLYMNHKECLLRNVIIHEPQIILALKYAWNM